MLSVHAVVGRSLPQRLSTIIPCKMLFLMLPCFLHLCPMYRKFLLSILVRNIRYEPIFKAPIHWSFCLPWTLSSRLLQHISKASIFFLPFLVIARASHPYEAIDFEKTAVALRNRTLSSMDRPLLFQIFTIFWVVFLTISNLRLTSVLLSLLLLISDTRCSNYSTSSIFCPSKRKSTSAVLSLSTTIFCPNGIWV